MSASELNELLDDYIHARKAEVCDAILQCAECLFKMKDCLKLQ